jgi:hypothetical protein
MVQQTVEHIGRVAHADVDNPGAERRVLVGNVGVEQLAGFGAVLGVDVARALGPAARAEALAVRRRRCAIPQCTAKACLNWALTSSARPAE